MARPALNNNVKYKLLVRKLGIARPHVRGLLETMWDVANECGIPILGSPEEVEVACEWDGKPGELFAALKECRLIDERDDGRWEVHDYWDHAPDYVKGRAVREAERRKPKTCAHCERDFRSTEVHAKYCSQACRQAKYRKSGDGALRSVTKPRVTVTEPLRSVTESDAPPAPAPAPLLSKERSKECSEPLSASEQTVPANRTVTDKPLANDSPHASVNPKPRTADACPGMGPAAVGNSVVMQFPVVGGKQKEWPLLQSKVAEYLESFPGVDVLAECQKALQWCRDNSKKRKTSGGMPAFLTRWLGKAQNRAPSRVSEQSKEPNHGIYTGSTSGGGVARCSRVSGQARKYEGLAKTIESNSSAEGDVPEARTAKGA